MNSSSTTAITAPAIDSSTQTSCAQLFQASPPGSGGEAPFHPAIHELAQAIARATGGAASVSWLPYRRNSRKFWAFDKTGHKSDQPLTLQEAASTVVPLETRDGGISKVSDSIDAYWLFTALESLLLSSAPAAVG